MMGVRAVAAQPTTSESEGTIDMKNIHFICSPVECKTGGAAEPADVVSVGILGRHHVESADVECQSELQYVFEHHLKYCGVAVGAGDESACGQPQSEVGVVQIRFQNRIP